VFLSLCSTFSHTKFCHAQLYISQLDDDIVTPAISTVLSVVGAAHGKADDLVIKPVMTEVVPRLLAPLSMFDDKKAEEKAIAEAAATPVALN